MRERGRPGGAVGAHVVCAFAPLSALVGSHQLGNWASGKICEQIPPPQLCKIDFTTPSRGASAHTYTQGGQARPTRGLIYATSDLAKPTQRERLSLSPPQQRSPAPIVNGLLTVDVKWLFLPPDFLFVIRVVSFSIQQWQEFGMGLRAMPSNPIESHSI